MKIIFVSIFLGISLICLGQIDFEEHLITDEYSNHTLAVFSSDIDGDGDIDLIASTQFDSKIVWYENLDGLGDYSLPKTISSTIDYASSLFVADIDGDGDQDVLSLSYTDNKVVWYENIDGLGDFSSENIISSTCNQAISVYAGDLDGDGDLDVVTASREDNKVSWHENIDGFGNFGPETMVTTNALDAAQVFIADIDNDGSNDIVSRSKLDDRIAWYKNLDGLGNFGEQQNIAFDGSPTPAYAEDMDGDGDLDILSTTMNINSSRKIVWYENEDGLGNFSLRKLITDDFGDASSTLYPADIDNDGDIDVVSSSTLFDEIVWYENTAGDASTWQEGVLGYENSQGITICADINGDSNIDVVIGDYSNVCGWVDLQSSWGQGYNTVPAFYPDNISSAYSSDIDGDGDQDIILTSEDDNRVSWYKNLDGHGNFSELYIINSDLVKPNISLTFDVDNDGDQDIIISSRTESKIVWLENLDGLGMFGDTNIICTTLEPNKILKADIDNDGDQDIIVASDSRNIYWLENTSSGFSAEKVIYLPNIGGLNSIFVEDIDGDGNKDVLAAMNDKLIWLKNLDGLGNFSAEILISNIANIRSVFLKDIDNDGDQDILFANQNLGQVSWLENLDGLGGFGPLHIIAEGFSQPRYINVLDLNNNGVLDIVVKSNYELVWLEGLDEQGNFGSKNEIIDNNFIIPVFSDLDGDGDQDIVTVFNYQDNKLYWFENSSPLTNSIFGRVYFDNQENGCSSNATAVRNVSVKTESILAEYKTFSLNNGYYQLYPPEGIFSTSANLNYFDSNPASYISDFSNIGNFDHNNDFCLTPNQIINDLDIVIIPLSPPRLGALIEFKIKIFNSGTTTMDGVTSIEFDDSKFEYIPSGSLLTLGPANTLTYEGPNQLSPFNSVEFIVSFMIRTPPEANIGEIVSLTAEIATSVNEENIINNFSFYKEEIVGSFDPNNIIVLEGNEVLISEADRYLHYTINFQNTGSDYAKDIVVKNILDENLDWNTFQLVSSSFNDMYVEVKNNNEVDFIFNDINLLDSTNYEAFSHGHVSYKIKPVNNISVGELIHNTADIFFDYNLPVETNIVETEIIEIVSVQDIELANTKIHPNPVITELFIESNIEVSTIEIYTSLGEIIRKKDQPLSINLSTLKPGVYYCKIINKEGTYIIKKFIKL